MGDYPYSPEEHAQIIRRLKAIGHVDPDLPEKHPHTYREIPEHRILHFSATPAFRGWKPLFVNESKAHPAKMNLNLLKWIIDTHTDPGDIVLDPMAGTGSTAILAFLAGRHGVAVEYEDTFFYMAEDNMEKTRRQAAREGYIRPGPKGRMTLIHGDARELSKLLEASDVIVSSPPYGNRLADAAVRDGDPARVGYRQAVDVVLTSPPYGPSQKGGGIAREGYTKPGEAQVTDPDLPLRHSRPLSDDPRNIDNLEYGEVDANIGNLKGETYASAMLRVYRECWNVLKPGGRMVLVTRNFIRAKQVIHLDLDTIKLCESAGFRLLDRWYFKLPTKSFWIRNLRKKYPDFPEVDYEDVLVFEKDISRIEPRKLEEAIVA